MFKDCNLNIVHPLPRVDGLHVNQITSCNVSFNIHKLGQNRNKSAWHKVASKLKAEAYCPRCKWLWLFFCFTLMKSGLVGARCSTSSFLLKDQYWLSVCFAFVSPGVYCDIKEHILYTVARRRKKTVAVEVFARRASAQNVKEHGSGVDQSRSSRGWGFNPALCCQKARRLSWPLRLRSSQDTAAGGRTGTESLVQKNEQAGCFERTGRNSQEIFI